MIIIYGSRNYGVSTRIDDDHAITRWVHLYWVPIVPTGSSWIAAGQPPIDIGLHGRSIATVYARVAAIVGAAVGLGLVASNLALASLIAFAGAAGLGALSFRWHRASARDLARAKFHRAIYDNSCPPELLPRAMRAQLRESLDARWPAIGGGRTPEDVARDGARSAAEAAAAYMILTLAGAHAEADRIVDGKVEPGGFGGPFRGVEYAPGAFAQVAQPAAASSPVAKISLAKVEQIAASKPTAPAPVTKGERAATAALVWIGAAAACGLGVWILISGLTMSEYHREMLRYSNDLGPGTRVVIGGCLCAVLPILAGWKWFVRGRSAWKA